MPVFFLSLDYKTIGHIQQRVLKVLHDQKRHEVFKHCARPGNQSSVTFHPGKLSPQPKPVLVINLPAGNGNIAGQPGFRCQQVIVRFGQHPFFYIVSNRKQLPFRVK